MIVGPLRRSHSCDHIAEGYTMEDLTLQYVVRVKVSRVLIAENVKAVSTGTVCYGIAHIEY